MSDWRTLTAREASLLELLLGQDFFGVAALRQQAFDPATRVRTLDEEGSIAFQIAGHLPVAEVLERVPVEVRSPPDGNPGVHVHGLLHVIDGLVSELEICADDGAVVTEWPPLDEWGMGSRS